MTAKRMRVFAGPNGSGKTTCFKGILTANNVALGVYVNADDIEATLKTTEQINFSDYKLNIEEKQVSDFFKQSQFAPLKRNESDLWTTLSVKDNILKVDNTIDSYLAADLAEFIRQQLLENNISFTYETVMSHSGKIDFLRVAQEKGFKVYLYYIATEDPEINISRVNVRVEQNGHSVSPEIIRTRYYKSLSNLGGAVKNSNRAYIFDNSGENAVIIAEITEGKDVIRNEKETTPKWVETYLFEQ